MERALGVEWFIKRTSLAQRDTTRSDGFRRRPVYGARSKLCGNRVFHVVIILD